MEERSQKTWNIPVSWEMCGVIQVSAPTLEEAIEMARDGDDEIPLPGNSDYVDGSWDAMQEDEDVIRKYYNSCQEDCMVFDNENGEDEGDIITDPSILEDLL